MTISRKQFNRRPFDGGFSIIELLVVIAIIVILATIALPQLPAMRRLHRSAAIPIQIKTQLRLARQQAMSQRRAVTFQYDDQLKRISIITHQMTGPGVLTAAGYPNTVGSTRSNTFILTGDGLSTSDLIYGLPAGVAGNLADTTTLTPLLNSQVNITFQPDGSVVNGGGVPVNFALFFHIAPAPRDTAYAISVLGSSGRVKVWRFSGSANNFVE